MKLQVMRNARRNLITGFLNKVVFLLMPFVERTIMRYVLGSLYLGLNSLFTSILSVLSLAELGFSSAIVYNMYKPIAENDVKTVNALLNLYKKVYRIIGCVVLTIGCLLIPFLPNLINGEYPNNVNIYIVYAIFLLNSSISYFMYSYLNSLLSAFQREDVHNIINTITTLCLYLSKIGIILALKSYYLAIIMMPIFTIIQNIIVALSAKRMFPEYRCEGILPDEKKSSIRKLVAGTFISRACAVTRNSLDSICTSAFLGLALTAVYNNYYTISHSVTLLLGIVTTSLLGGIGNHVATKSVDENFVEQRRINFVYMLVSGWSLIYLVCLFQPFMSLWMGTDMLLTNTSVYLMGLYFYTLKIGDVLSMYSSSNGLWWQHRYRALGETIANFILNVALGKIFGVNGIISATIISLFIFNFICGAQITFKNYFKSKDYVRQYYVDHGKYFLVNSLCLVLSIFVCRFLSIENLVLKLIFNAVICTIIPAILFFAIYRANADFKYIESILLKKLKIKRKDPIE